MQCWCPSQDSKKCWIRTLLPLLRPLNTAYNLLLLHDDDDDGNEYYLNHLLCDDGNDDNDVNGSKFCQTILLESSA